MLRIASKFQKNREIKEIWEKKKKEKKKSVSRPNKDKQAYMRFYFYGKCENISISHPSKHYGTVLSPPS